VGGVSGGVSISSTSMTRAISIIVASAFLLCPSRAEEQGRIRPGGAFRRLIVRRDDKPDSAYLADPQDYPAVFPIDPYGSEESGECCATLVTAQHAITASHCFDDGKWKEFPVTINGTSNRVVSVHVNPCFDYAADGPDGHDIAVLRLESLVPDSIEPYEVYLKGDEEGKNMTIMGWGDTGIAGGKAYMDRTFRVAQNKVETVEDGMLKYTFDNPSSGTSRPLEGIAWAGDSGGPLLIKGEDGKDRIAGVNSAGDCCGYGSTDAYKRAADHYEWLKAVISDDPGNASTLLTGTSEADGGRAGWIPGNNCTWFAKRWDDDDDFWDHPYDYWYFYISILGGVVLIGIVSYGVFVCRGKKRRPSCCGDPLLDNAAANPVAEKDAEMA